MRTLTYAEAINEGLAQAFDLSEDVVMLGQLVDTSGVFGTTKGLAQKYGRKRVQDFSVSESLMTSAGMGAALAGMRPVLVHHRLDFMIYAMDAITNWLSLWRLKSNGDSRLPVTIRAVVGKGWGQGPQHSKCLHAWFAHLPGLRVAVPATAHDAKGLLLESIFGEDPTIILENRSLFSMTDGVPQHPYRVPFGHAAIRRAGQHVSVVALGIMVPVALRAAATLARESIDVEVIDLRTVSPLDRTSVLASVRKTGRLVVADPGWRSVGVAAELIALVSENLGRELRANPVRVCLPDSHTPASPPLESSYYPDEAALIAAIRATGLSPRPVMVRSVERQAFDPQDVQARCRRYRRRILDVSQTVTALHIAPSFSCMELVATIYFGLMKRTGDPETEDTFILSKGHGSLAQFAVLEDLGVIPRSYLENYCRPGWPLATHPDFGTAGIAASTGSLGHGLGLAVGMAYADRMKGRANTIYVVLSDGELQEGSVWEALMTAPSLGITQLVALVDLNDFQSLGRTSEVLPNFYPMLDKVRAFGWEAVAVDGHDPQAIYDAVAQRQGDRPLIVLGSTVKGKGVSFMENVPVWHYRSPNAEEYRLAVREVEAGL